MVGIDSERSLMEIAYSWFEHKSKAVGYTVFPRTLSVVWGDDERYWEWIHEVPKLLRVCWLEVRGKLEMCKLTTGTKYEIVFMVKMLEDGEGWESPVTFTVDLPGGASTSAQVVLKDLPKEELVMIAVSDFIAAETGEINFSITETTELNWKTGMMIKGAIARPAYY